MKTKNETIKYLGTIENRSGVFHAVDAYIDNHTFQAKVTNVAKGHWEVNAVFTKFGNQEICKALQLSHESLGSMSGEDIQYDFVEEDVGIDTGTIKIIDADTLENPVSERSVLAEILLGGVKASTGLGDGLYFVGVCKNPVGKVVGVFIDFIDE